MTSTTLPAGLTPLKRDSTELLAELLAQRKSRWGDQQDLWVFGYASLIWRPEFKAAERRAAYVPGWHRSFRMRSRVNRGTPEQPGLVFALLRGGSCNGVVDRMPKAHAKTELARLWVREMPTGVYEPKWLACRTAKGIVPALAFTLSHQHEAYLGPIPDERMLHILRHATGRYGRTLHYLADTEQALHAQGIKDSEVTRVMALARQHGLLPRP
jgi:glutathione-specific gamma-glutamylcyclotransferase